MSLLIDSDTRLPADLVVHVLQQHRQVRADQIRALRLQPPSPSRARALRAARAAAAELDRALARLSTATREERRDA